MCSSATHDSTDDLYVQSFQFLIQDDAGRICKDFEPNPGLILQLENELRWSLELACPSREGAVSIEGPAGLWFQPKATCLSVPTPAGQFPGLEVSLSSSLGYTAETEAAIAELGDKLAKLINSTLPLPVGVAVVVGVTTAQLNADKSSLRELL